MGDKGGAVASRSVAVWVRALAGGHCVVFLGKTLYSHSASLHPGVYKWVPANKMLGVTWRWTSILWGGGGGVKSLLVASWFTNRDKAG